MKFLTNIFRKLTGPKAPKSIWKDSPYVIKFAFRACGIDYYMMDDMVNKPYERALTAIDFYNELSMNVDAEYIKLHTRAVRELLTTKKTINVFEIHKLNEQLSERVNMIKSPNLIYKLASVVYFDKNEDPTKYDFKYNDEKIRRWKREFPGGSFFLQKPIQDLVPFLKESDMNLKTYHETMEKVESIQLENLLSHLSEKASSSVKSKADE